MRVVAGELRGRRLHTPRDRVTRPTSERARQALFDWLGPRVVDARVADLFAGSGALGIEALSRHAESAVFVERARPALRALRRNLEELDLTDRATVVGRDVQSALAGFQARGERFSLVLADPPYAAAWLDRLADPGILVELLEPEGALLVECDARTRPRASRRSEGREQRAEDSALTLRDARVYGGTMFEWYETGPPATGGSEGGVAREVEP